MARIKVSQKKLLHEPDELRSLSQRAWLRVHDSPQQAAAVAGAVALCALAFMGGRWYFARAREQRAAEVARAVTSYLAATEGTALTNAAKELETVSTKHAGSPEGLFARYLSAAALVRRGQPEQATSVLKGLEAGNGKGGEMPTLALVADGYISLARGDEEAALATFRRLVEDKGRVVPRAQLEFEIAGIHERAGRAAEARAVYKRLSDPASDGPLRQRAEEHLRRLRPAEGSGA